MSAENVEVVRRALAAYTRGELEAMLSHIDPEGELQSAIIGGAEGNVFRGHDRFRSWFAESMEAFEELTTETRARDARSRSLRPTCGAMEADRRGDKRPSWCP